MAIIIITCCRALCPDAKYGQRARAAYSHLRTHQGSTEEKFLRNVFEGTESAEIEFSEIFHKFPCYSIWDLKLVVAPELFYPEVGRHYLVLQVLRNYIVYIRFDTFICKARLGDILSYVPDLTKSRFWERDWSLGQVENLIWSISGSQDKFDPFAP